MIVIEPTKASKYSLLLLHGLGANGEDLANLVPMLEQQLPQSRRGQIRYLCPDAPVRPVSLNNGYPMRAWFDIYGLDAQAPIDRDGIAASVLTIRAILAEQLTELGAQNVLVGGFSQGGVIALHAALGLDEKLAGVLALSTWLPAVDLLPDRAKNPELPIFLGHGLHDEIVPLSAAEQAIELLKTMGMRRIERHVYAMGHAILPEEIADIAEWIARVTSD